MAKSSNLERYRDDLDALLEEGERVRRSLLHEALGKRFEQAVLEHYNGDNAAAEKAINDLPKFRIAYQSWYSESLALIKQLMPDRLNDFVRHYEKPKNRKEIGFENYRIEDALQGLRVSQLGETIADAVAALPHLEQQIAILVSIKRRFESSLFEIRQLVQADLFDSELDAARELLKSRFARAAGAIAGVVLEKHLAQVCANHSLRIAKKHPSIADLNEILKAASVVDVPLWRFIQHLADIRNLCDHNKQAEPTADQVGDLIRGVDKVSKTLY